MFKKTEKTTGNGGTKRSQVTGRQMGRAAIRSANKNCEASTSFVDELERGKSAVTDICETDILAKVTRSPGGFQLEVKTWDHKDIPSVPIAGRLRFRGKSATKTDRDNCFCVGDIIVISGGMAVAKLSGGQVERVKAVFKKHGVETPRGFFGINASGGDDDDEAGGFLWDRSGEGDEDKTSEAEEEVDIDTI
jgi:hypothetical protein